MLPENSHVFVSVRLVSVEYDDTFHQILNSIGASELGGLTLLEAENCWLNHGGQGVMI